MALYIVLLNNDIVLLHLWRLSDGGINVLLVCQNDFDDYQDCFLTILSIPPNHNTFTTKYIMFLHKKTFLMVWKKMLMIIERSE